jgi:hypothetical protein
MDDDNFDGTIPGRRFRLVDLAVVGAGFLSDVVAATETATDLLHNLACRHANWLVNRERFREQAALEIEALTRNPGE